MKIQNDKIEFDNGKVLNFDFPVMKILVHHSTIIVLLNVPPKIIFNENVYGANSAGELLWQIVKTEKATENCAFIDMHVNEKDGLILRNWCHLHYEIDSLTGRILSTEEYGW